MSFGPLGKPAWGWSECFPFKSATFGWQIVDKGTIRARLTKVVLANPHRLRLMAVELVPIGSGTAIGAENGYPPTKHDLSLVGDEWSRRHPIPAVVDPKVSHRYDLLIGIRPEGSSGTASGMDIYYSVGATQYLLPTHYALEMRPSCGDSAGG